MVLVYPQRTFIVNSLEELNNWGNTSVTFVEAQLYSINLTNAGNTSDAVNEEAVFLVPKQVTVNTLSNAYTDLLVTVTTTNTQAIKNLAYTGTNSRIHSARIGTAAWRVYGIRTVSDYNNVFDNLFVTLGDDRTESFNFIVQLNDQLNTTASYTVSINVLAQPEFSIPSSIVFNEGLTANIQPVVITDAASGNPQYRVTVATGNSQQGVIGYQGNSSNSVTVTNTRSAINNAFSSGEIRWEPIGDFAANSSITYTQIRVSDGAVHANAVPIVMAIGNTHSEFSIPSSITFNEDQTKTLPGFSITDVRFDNPEYSVTLATGNSQQGQISFQGVPQNSYTFVGNKAVINTVLNTPLSWVPAPDFAGNSTILYSQTRLSDGVVHANAVPVTMVGVPSPDFQITPEYWTENTRSANLQISVVDVAVGKNYQGTVTANTGGQLFVGNTASGNTVVITGNKSQMNSQLAQIRFVSNNYGDFPWTYTQVQTTDNINQGTATGTFKTPRLLGPGEITGNTYQQSSLLDVNANFVFPSGSEFYRATTRWGYIDNVAPGTNRFGYKSLQTVLPYVPVDSTTATVGTHSIALGGRSFQFPGSLPDSYYPTMINRLDPATNGLQPGQAATIEFYYRNGAQILGTGGVRNLGLEWIAPDTAMNQRVCGLFPNVGQSLIYDQGQVYTLFQYDYQAAAAGVNGIYGISEPYARSATPVVADTWYHVAITVNTDYRVRIFVNGVEAVYLRNELNPATNFQEQTDRIVTQWFATSTGMAVNPGFNNPITGSNPWYFWGMPQAIGKRIGYGDTFARSAAGNIDNVRISRGLRYTAPFTPPTTQQVTTDGNTVLVMRGLSAGI